VPCKSPAVKSPDPNILTGSGFVEFRDLETATEALARVKTPELALAYTRPIAIQNQDPSHMGAGHWPALALDVNGVIGMSGSLWIRSRWTWVITPMIYPM
jgi:hypothetical protein